MENIQFFMVVQRKQAIGGTGFLPSTVSLIFLGTNFGNISQIVRPGKHQFLPVFWVFEGCFSAEDNHLHEAKRRQTDYTLSGPRILILIYLYSLYIFIYSCILYIIYNCTCMICIYIYIPFLVFEELSCTWTKWILLCSQGDVGDSYPSDGGKGARTGGSARTVTCSPLTLQTYYATCQPY